MLRAERQDTAANLVVVTHNHVIRPCIESYPDTRVSVAPQLAELAAAQPTADDLVHRDGSRRYVRLLDRANAAIRLNAVHNDGDELQLWWMLSRVHELAKIARRRHPRGPEPLARLARGLLYRHDGFPHDITRWLDPLDALRIELVATGMTWTNADHIVTAATSPCNATQATDAQPQHSHRDAQLPAPPAEPERRRVV